MVVFQVPFALILISPIGCRIFEPRKIAHKDRAKELLGTEFDHGILAFTQRLAERVTEQTPAIGTLNEGALHAALKQHYGGDDGQFEVPFSGFVVDVVRDGTIFEIQTSSFSGLERKMRALAEQCPVVLVHPIAAQKTLVRIKIPAVANLAAASRRRKVRFAIFLVNWCICRVC